MLLGLRSIAAASNNDNVGRVMSHLNVGIFTDMILFLIVENCFYTTLNFCTLIFHNLVYILNRYVYFAIFQRAIKEERYSDAAFLRDKVGA